MINYLRSQRSSFSRPDNVRLAVTRHTRLKWHTMRIDGNHIAASLKLAPALGSKTSTAPQVANATPSPAARSADSFRFETVYLRTLPIVTQTEAHRRLEHIRRELVAARTDVPIHFEHPVQKSRNPYVPQHLRFGPEPAGLNESATDFAAEALQKKHA